MAIYHLEAKVVSRGAGRSAVAASAYLSCSRLYNDYDGIRHDYNNRNIGPRASRLNDLNAIHIRQAQIQ